MTLATLYDPSPDPSIPTTYESSDIYLVAALTTVGCSPSSYESKDNHLRFRWTNPEVRMLIRRYYGKDLLIDARTFADELRQVKILLHNVPEQKASF